MPGRLGGIARTDVICLVSCGMLGLVWFVWFGLVDLFGLVWLCLVGLLGMVEYAWFGWFALVVFDLVWLACLVWFGLNGSVTFP